MGQLGDLSPQGSVAVGVIVGLISTSLQAIGLTLQRKSHILEDEKYPYDLHRPPYKRRRWQMGMLMFVISNIAGSTIQITTLPLPVLSTLGASGLVFNTVFATLILGESFTKYSLVGTILVTIGAVLIALFGAVGEPAHTLDQLLELLARRKFIIWMVCTGVLVVAILMGCRFLRFFLPSSRSKRSSIVSIHLQRFHGRIRLIRGMCYGFVSGVLSAHSLLLAKSAVELLVRTIVDRVNQFNRWQSWVILLGMITLALTQLFYLHRGLKLCSTSVLYPFVFCVYNIIAILDGLIYFRQASQLAGFHAGLIALGTIVLLGGVLCLSWRLEDIDSHANTSMVSQTTLGPGMGMVDEHAARDLGLNGEENGERQPLLQKTYARRGSITQRAPSLPLFTPFPKDSTTYTEPASIWAELDDSDYDCTGLNTRSPAYHSFSSRPRSKSGTYASNGVPKRFTEEGMPSRGMRHSSGSMLYRTWDPRRIPSSIHEGRWRRTSASVAETRQSKRRSWSPLLYTDETTPLAQDDRNEQSSTHDHDNQQSYLAGSRSRNILATAWRNGLRYLSRRIGYRQGQSDPEAQSQS
ncbi:DUF803 domain protein [Aspergillus sclerotialis]|uniref:DUF803 domain protein n=1 Tax=Aspergillus sclerotialis TaxID=2070753 RepID=A0A3A2ZMX2_9EURO|nr:DUF803 domain protein [Aspergillus sclerotialis]